MKALVKQELILNIPNNETKVKVKSAESGKTGKASEALDKKSQKLKVLNNTESLILAQDERWRSA